MSVFPCLDPDLTSRELRLTVYEGEQEVYRYSRRRSSTIFDTVNDSRDPFEYFSVFSRPVSYLRISKALSSAFDGRRPGRLKTNYPVSIIR